MFSTGETVSLAEWIIDASDLWSVFLEHFRYISLVNN